MKKIRKLAGLYFRWDDKGIYPPNDWHKAKLFTSQNFFSKREARALYHFLDDIFGKKK